MSKTFLILFYLEVTRLLCSYDTVNLWYFHNGDFNPHSLQILHESVRVFSLNVIIISFYVKRKQLY